MSSTTVRTTRSRLGTVLPYAAVATAAALTLAACGPSSSATTGGSAPSTTAPTTSGSGGGGGGQRQPGVNGLVAAVSGSTMQVQTRTDQTAVSWTGSTTFSKVAPGSAADVQVGSCVTVLPAASEAAGSGTSVTAATVDVRPATNGECNGGFGGAGYGGGTRPSGAPTGAPGGSATTGSGGTGGAGRGGGARVVAGLVSAVSGGTITVQETMRTRGASGSATTGTTGGSGGTGGTAGSTAVTVTTTSSTTYTTQQSASASDVAVGECVSAQGQADETGAVAATAVSLRPATGGSCSGPGGRGGATASMTTGAGNG